MTTPSISALNRLWACHWKKNVCVTHCAKFDDDFNSFQGIAYKGQTDRHTHSRSFMLKFANKKQWIDRINRYLNFNAQSSMDFELIKSPLGDRCVSVISCRFCGQLSHLPVKERNKSQKQCVQNAACTDAATSGLSCCRCIICMLLAAVWTTICMNKTRTKCFLTRH